MVSCTTSGYRPLVIMVRYSVRACAAHVWTPALASAKVSHRTRACGCRMRGRGSAGRASPCQGEGRGFESRRPLGASLAQSLWGEMFSGWSGREARQRTANPCTRVQIPSPPRAIGAVGARFPDTEEVTGSNPVSPTSNTPGQMGFCDQPRRCTSPRRRLASPTANLTGQLAGHQTMHPWPSRRVSTRAEALCDRPSQ